MTGFWGRMRAKPSGVKNMETHEFTTTGVCSRKITFDLDGTTLHNVRFDGGCPGNTAAIGKLLEGADARRAADILRGNDCRGRGTSCADQLARAIDEALS